jgi:RNA polymerase sigma-70 factor (ECF subfamily)
MKDDFHALYVRYSPDVFRFALYLSGDRHDAEDITSETFVRAWTAPGPIRAATVKGYLLTIARNLFLAGRKKRAREVPVPESIADPGPGPTAPAELDSELAAAVASLQRLSEVDRAALVMRAVEEMSYDEIAHALGISLAATKVRIHRARLALAAIHET